MLDLSDVLFCDSAGLNLLLRASKWAASRDVELVLACVEEAGVVEDEDPVGLAEPFGYVVLEVVAEFVGVPTGTVEEALEVVGGSVSGVFGQLPAVFAEAAKRQARTEYAEAYRVRHLEAQHAAWQRTAGLVGYVGALRLHAEALPPGPAREEADAWIAWTESHIQRLNPLNGSPLLPEIPEPRTEDLQPFMHGWSPYGPT